jgi:hypothetical protein
LVVAVAAGVAAGDPPQPNAGDTGQTTADTPSELVGMTAEHDAELRNYLEPRLDRSDLGLVEVRDRDGGFSMDPQGRFQTMVLVRITANGTPEIGCFDDFESAMRFLRFEDRVAAPPAEDRATD